MNGDVFGELLTVKGYTDNHRIRDSCRWSLSYQQGVVGFSKRECLED